jgi:5'-nucleotidase (lipoprotein e(P4) family)
MQRLRHIALLIGTAAASGCAQGPAVAPVASASALPAPANDAVAAMPAPPPAMQYLYGSGEAAALSIAVFRALADHGAAQAARRPEASVILTADSTLDAPSFVPCGDKPLAAVFDVDETLIANVGYEQYEVASGKPYDKAVWAIWERTGAEKVTAIPGAVSAVNALRRAGVTVIFNTNRVSEYAAQTAAAIKFAGLGEAVHGETLFLKGDDASGSAKDGRRAVIAARYCVVALGGDQLGDFSDLFNQEGMTVKGRRAEVASGWATQLWGKGWFLLPNPVYGTALKGGQDDIFPTDKRWTIPPEEKK